MSKQEQLLKIQKEIKDLKRHEELLVPEVRDLLECREYTKVRRLAEKLEAIVTRIEWISIEARSLQTDIDFEAVSDL